MSWLTEPEEDWDEQQPHPRNRLKLAAVMLAGWLAVSLIVLAGLLTFSGRSASDKPSSAPSGDQSTTAGPSAPGSGSSAPTSPVPDGWVLRAGDEQADCAAHSYGQVQVFFARTPCASVRRSLLSTEQDGRSVVVAASVVSFASPIQAAGYLHLVTSDGTGNINDLLREGARYPGSPSKLPTAAFASRQDGARVLVAEAAFADQPQSRSDYQDATLQAAARLAVGSG